MMEDENVVVVFPGIDPVIMGAQCRTLALMIVGVFANYVEL